MPDPNEEVIEAGEDPSEINSEEPAVYGSAKHHTLQGTGHYGYPSTLVEHGQVTAINPADRLIELAITSNADVDRLDQLLALKERYDREEARKAFTRAMAAFKAEAIVIKKDKHIQFPHNDGAGETNYWHATLGNIINLAVPAMAKHGLSHRWVSRQGDGAIHMKCVITHCDGHSEETPDWSAQADGSGKKNPIQQVASTKTYLQRYTFLEATGLAVEEQDNDGSTPVPPKEPVPSITEEQVLTIHAMITDNDLDMDIFLRWLANTAARAATIKDIPAPFYDKVVTKIKATIKAAKEKAK